MRRDDIIGWGDFFQMFDEMGLDYVSNGNCRTEAERIEIFYELQHHFLDYSDKCIRKRIE